MPRRSRPPGSGKTYLGAAASWSWFGSAVWSASRANSHKVIGHLLDEVARRRPSAAAGADRSEDRHARGLPRTPRAFYGDNGELLEAIGSGALDVVGGTAWVWSRPEFAACLDTLVVDEAGQLSLANAVAVSPAARNLILLGDPQQLDQPLQGTHPPGAEASALGHVLGDDSTMPPERGLFLERTRRLHPDLCRFTSEAFYEGRLESVAGLENQDLESTGALSGTGVRFVPARHAGNSSESSEEARGGQAGRGLVAGGSTWTDREGGRHRLGWGDVVVVSPYNAQVSEIGRRLPAARVGTVDKFQGQEAPVSIYSMATSGPEEAPRGMEFLYSLNRLNVATSRARCLAAVVASPDLVRVRARTPRQMRLANALCRFLEMAAPPVRAAEDTPHRPRPAGARSGVATTGATSRPRPSDPLSLQFACDCGDRVQFARADRSPRSDSCRRRAQPGGANRVERVGTNGKVLRPKELRCHTTTPGPNSCRCACARPPRRLCRARVGAGDPRGRRAGPRPGSAFGPVIVILGSGWRSGGSLPGRSTCHRRSAPGATHRGHDRPGRDRHGRPVGRPGGAGGGGSDPQAEACRPGRSTSTATAEVTPAERRDRRDHLPARRERLAAQHA